MDGQLILNRIAQHAKEIQRQYGVKKLALFGSYARNQGTEKSDIDFLVQFTSKTFDNYMGLKLYLEDLFQRPVDLVTQEALKPQLRNYILQEAIDAKEL